MMKNYKYTPSFYYALASFFVLGGSSYATTYEVDSTTSVEVYANQLPTYTPLNSYGSFMMRMDKKMKLTEQEFLAKANDVFGLYETNTFKLIDTQVDALGMVHNTYQHYVGKYPVEGQMFIVHSKKGWVTSVNGTIINIENKKSVYSLRGNVDRKPAIQQSDAVTIALKANRITPVEAMDYPTETVFVKSGTEDGLFVLAHKVRVDDLSRSNIISKHVFVGVEKGEIVNEISLMAHANVPGKGNGFYRDNLPLGLSLVNGQYQLRDTERGVITYNAESLKNQWDIYKGLGDVVEHTTTTFPDSPANDIHWGLARTYDYYKEVHNRDSYDGKGGDIRAYYNPVAMDGDDSGFPNNAVAMPTPFNMLVFGRGSANFNPLTVLDVTGHEFTHLVVGNNGRGGLQYQGESGALNEGFADIFGTSVEHYAVNDADWLIGAGILRTSGAFHYMRSMEDPKNNHASSRQPNTYKGTYWASTSFGAWDNGGVHVNSGVINFWYYLLTEGGTGVNDKGNDYIVSGIGMQKAEQIAFQTLMTQLGANSQYIDAVEGSLTVAELLYGEDSGEYDAVYDAWYAVGFGDPRPNMGIEDFELTEDVFSMYPNPISNGELTVLIKDEKGTVVFYNMAGQKVTQTFTVEKGENKISVPQLKTGNYIVVYESKERKVSEKVIVK